MSGNSFSCEAQGTSSGMWKCIRVENRRFTQFFGSLGFSSTALFSYIRLSV